MWKQSETKRIGINKEPIKVSWDDLRYGLSPDIEKFLLSQGIDGNLLGEIRQKTAGFPDLFSVQKIPAEIQRAAATVQKQSSQVNAIKTVIDGSKFELPPEIAVTVHVREGCAPAPQ